MTSRERIQKLYRREKLDKIPSGLCGCETAGMHFLTYEKMCRILGMEPVPNRMYTSMLTSIGEQEFLRRTDSDYIILNTRLNSIPFWAPGSENSWKDIELLDHRVSVNKKWDFRTQPNGDVFWEPYHWCMVKGSTHFDSIPEPLDLMNFEYPNPDDYNPPHDIPDEYLRALETDAKYLYDNTDYSILTGETITDLQYQFTLGSFEKWWMTLMEEPEIAHEILDKAVKSALDQLVLVDQAVGKYADTMLIADDMGDNRGVTVGAELWREMFKPHYMELFQGWKKRTHMKILLHSCGSIAEILDDLVECGIDILNPVQVSASGMDPESLQQKFGDRVIFYGGAYDATLNPPEKTYEEVYASTRKNIETLSRSGGYIFAGVHNMPANMPEDHIRAVLDAYRDSKYL